MNIGGIRLLAASTCLAVGVVGAVSAPSVGQTATKNSAIERKFSDPRMDVPRAKGFSRAERRSVDIRRVRVWQRDHRDAFVTVKMSGRRPASLGAKYNWSTWIRMDPARPKYHPRVYVFFQGRGTNRSKAFVDAVWKDGTSESCTTRVKVLSKGRAYRVFLPYRCSWWTVNEILASTNAYAKGGRRLGGDRRRVAARLNWDDDLGR